MVSSIVENAAENNSQLKGNWAMSLVMVLSQDDTIRQHGLGWGITDLQVQGQVENHIAEMAHVINWVLKETVLEIT